MSDYYRDREATVRDERGEEEWRVISTDDGVLSICYRYREDREWKQANPSLDIPLASAEQICEAIMDVAHREREAQVAGTEMSEELRRIAKGHHDGSADNDGADQLGMQ